MADQDGGFGGTSTELAELSERTLGPLTRRVNEFNLKAIGEGWKAFKRILGTITEPFFRAGMGERYYAAGAFGVGIMIWTMAGLISSLFAPEASIAALLCRLRAFHFLAFIFQSKYFPIVFGLLMAFVQARVGIRNIRESSRLRREGVIHHSRSRGAAVWQNEPLAFVVMEGILLMFNWPIAVLFGAGYSMNAMLKAAQAAAIMERYLDAVDKDIEDKYLKDCALGNQPPEMTFLYHQLDPAIKPEVREKMAAALVGETVSIVAKPPQKKNATPPTRNTETPPISAEPESQHSNTTPIKRSGLAAISPMSQEEFDKLWKIGIFLRRFFIYAVVIALGTAIVIYTVRFIQSHHKSTPVASTQITTERQQPAAPATITTDTRQPAAPANIPQPIVAAAPAIQGNIVSSQNSARAQITEKFNNTLSAESIKLADFMKYCDGQLSLIKTILSGMNNYSIHDALVDQYNALVKQDSEIIKLNEKILNSFQKTFEDRSTNPQYNLQRIVDALEGNIPKMDKTRQEFTRSLDAFNDLVTRSAQKK